MATILTNAILADIDPIRIEHGELRIDGATIAERGPSVSRKQGDEAVDCGGCVVLPGLVNGHTHLYSALAVGMPLPPKTPRNFHEILKFVWWRLDQALDAESIETSARIGALAALRCGTTTLIDHHASPNHIAGSLDLIERALGDVGVRGVLCYETTDRHGPAGCDAGIEENRRYLHACVSRTGGQFAGLVGAHASFTLEDASLDRLAALALECDSGVHIHVAEDPCDEADCRRRFNRSLIDRLAEFALLRPHTVFAHGTHLDADAIARVNDAGLTMAHNPRSNMNNAVGYAPVASFQCPVMLGTDGIGSDLFAEAKAAWYVSRHAQAGLAPNDLIAMIAASARRASRSLGVTLGKLEPGAAADIVVTHYRPFTPLTSDNLAGHFIFGLAANHVRGVLVGGQWKLRDGEVLSCDATATRLSAHDMAAALWDRMANLPVD